VLLADRFPDLELRIPCVTAGWLPRREEVKTGLRLSLSTTLELDFFSSRLLCDDVSPFKEESEGWKFSLLRDQSVVDMAPD